MLASTCGIDINCSHAAGGSYS